MFTANVKPDEAAKKGQEGKDQEHMVVWQWFYVLGKFVRTSWNSS